MEGSGTERKRGHSKRGNAAIVAYGHPRTQGADCPAAGAARGLSVLQRGRRHDLRRQRRAPSATACATISARRLGFEDRRPAERGRAPRGDRHRFGGGGAGAREQPHQTAGAEVQHPPSRRQELSVPPADHERGVSARPGRAARGARRQLLRRAVPARHVRAQDDGADAPAVRDAVVQRGDHRQARSAVPRVRHQALHRAVCRFRVQRRRVWTRGEADAAVSRRARTTSC